MDLRSLKSVFVIAEIGQNHQGDINVAKTVIKLPEISVRLRPLSAPLPLIKLISLKVSISPASQKMIREASRAGVDCVKFQKSCLAEKFTRSALERPYDSVNSFGSTYGEHKRHLEFSIQQFQELKDYAELYGLVFSASAMDKVSRLRRT